MYCCTYKSNLLSLFIYLYIISLLLHTNTFNFTILAHSVRLVDSTGIHYTILSCMPTLTMISFLKIIPKRKEKLEVYQGEPSKYYK